MNVTDARQSNSALHWTLFLCGFWIVLLAVYSLFLGRWGHDSFHHISGLAELYKPFSQWQFDTYLSPVIHLGQGIPVYIFYSQWVYIPPFLFTLLGFGLSPAFIMTFMLLIIIAWIGSYKLARLHVSVNSAIMSAMMFTSCNYFLGGIYANFAYGQFFGYAILPLILFSFHKALINPSRIAILFAIFMFSLLILTYPFGMLNAAPLIAMYCLVILPDKQHIFGFVFRGLIISTAILAVTAFFWLPGAIEQSYMNGGDAIEVGKNYLDTFWSLNKVLDIAASESLGIFLSVILILAIGCHLLKFRACSKANILLVFIIFYMFLFSVSSDFIWQTVPFMKSTMAVSRMLIPLSLITALYCAFIFDLLIKNNVSAFLVPLLSCLMLVQGSLLIYRHTAELDIDQQRFSETFTSDIDDQIEFRLKFYRNIRRGIGIDEFKLNLNSELPGLRVSSNECFKEVDLPPYVTDIQRQNIVVAYNLDNAGCFVRLPLLWYPRYEAFDDTGERLKTGFNQRGEIMIEATKQNGTMSVRFGEPNYVKWAKRISIYAFLSITLFALFPLLRRWY